jgi:RND superfamily putative drug exporter
VAQPRNIAARAGRWSAHHRKTAILGWIAFVLISFLIGGAVGTQELKDEDLGSGESRQAERLIADAGLKERANEQVLVQSRGSLRVDDEAFHAAIDDVTSRLRANDDLVEIASPLASGNSGQIAADQRSALVLFQIKGDADEAEERVGPVLDDVAAAQRAHPDLRIEQFGDASADKALSKALEDDFRRAETLSLPITLLILLFAFGALVAAGLPVILGLTAVAATLGLLAPISQLWPMDSAVNSVVLCIGLAVGVDYSLFYIRREREERRAGRSNEAALEAAAATSGRAVLVSGVTVMVAMAGMYLTGDATFTSFGTGTILVVAVAMLGSISVLPALLSKLGDRVDKGRVPFLGRRRSDSQAGGWAFVLTHVLRHPVASVLAAGGLLVALTIPAFGLHTVSTGIQGLPPDLPVTQTLKRVNAAFPGGPLPATVVVKADDVTAAPVERAIASFEIRAIGTGLVRHPIEVRVNDAGNVAVVSTPLAGSGTDATSERALEALRTQVIPETLGTVDGAETHVGGLTAQSVDFNEQMTSRAPWVFGFVLGLAFLLLMVTFRSIVIPLKAIVLNLLSVGAAYGVLVLVFQDGRFESLLGFESIGGITAWLPLFLFVILFGLSMDYHVLILSRVREAYDRGMTTEEAVSTGIRATAGVVTSAAIVMVAVFAIFATLSGLDFKMLGVGLATAVLIDATIVRAVLLPASMKLLGDWNWYLPKWLDWLPQVEVEDSDDSVEGLRIDVAERADGLHVSLAGDLDLTTAEQLGARLRDLESSAPAVTILDLRGLRFMDSTGIAQLFQARRRASAEGRRLVVVKGSEPIDRILEIVRADSALELVEDPADVR